MMAKQPSPVGDGGNARSANKVKARLLPSAKGGPKWPIRANQSGLVPIPHSIQPTGRGVLGV